VHAGRHDLGRLGVHAPPLDRSTTYPVPDLDTGAAALLAFAEGAATAVTPVYARLHNPTTARWERAVAELEHAEDAVAYASGMAAITATLLAAGAIGGHVVAVRPLYGGTDHLLASGLLDIEVTWAAAADVAEAVRGDTRLVLVETPANPTLALVDIAAVVAAAGDVPVAVDNTFATPVLQQPLDHGASYTVHSATKYLGGHGDVMAGVVATTAERAGALRQVRILTGAVLDPQAAWLLHRSLPTLPARVRDAQAGAAALVERLVDHPAVARVSWPGLAACDPDGLVGRQMRGPGAMLAFDVVGGHDQARCVHDAVQLITSAVSLGSTDTLIEHPAALTHALVDEADRAGYGVGPGTLRLSVGLEDPEDLWADLGGALDRVGVATSTADG
jgi:cystathionine beta-lyase/cystathionine gamma-synthase